MITQAVILARGLGTRMRRDDSQAQLDDAQRAAASEGLKGMIPIGRPFMDYLISALADAGVTDVCLVIGPQHHQVRAHYGSGLARVRVHFAVQEHPLGTADALLAAREFAGRHTVLSLNSDNYYPVEAYRRLMALEGSGLIGFDYDALVRESNIPPERAPRCLVERGADGALRTLIEKPDDATFDRLIATSLVSMNLWAFTPVIFEACTRVRPSARGELELQDAVRIAREELGERFSVVPFSGGVLDLSSRADIPAVARATGHEGASSHTHRSGAVSARAKGRHGNACSLATLRRPGRAQPDASTRRTLPRTGGGRFPAHARSSLRPVSVILPMRRFFCLALLSLLAAPVAVSSAQRAMPPVAEQVPKVDTIHGYVRTDPYFWLREKSNPKVIEYLKSENAYTDVMTAHTKALEDSVYREIVGRIKETDNSVPYRDHGYWYYTKTEQGKAYPIYARRKGSMQAPEQVIFDQNKEAEGKTFLSLGGFDVSPDGSILAILVDTTGYEDFELRFRDLATIRTFTHSKARLRNGVGIRQSNPLLLNHRFGQTQRQGLAAPAGNRPGTGRNGVSRPRHPVQCLGRSYTERRLRPDQQQLVHLERVLRHRCRTSRSAPARARAAAAERGVHGGSRGKPVHHPDEQRWTDKLRADAGVGPHAREVGATDTLHRFDLRRSSGRLP
jgi:glucose-1-phosphate thymidylyltransferase